MKFTDKEKSMMYKAYNRIIELKKSMSEEDAIDIVTEELCENKKLLRCFVSVAVSALSRETEKIKSGE
jgi:uncharacterized protein YoaH (UPF0181 family)